MRILCLALIFAALSCAQRVTNCSNDTAALTNRCDMVPCTDDDQCASRDCNDNFCWDQNFRPQNCDTNSSALFYKCERLPCNRDVECYDNNCYKSKCELYRNDDLPWWAIVLIVIGLLILAGIGSIFIRQCIAKRNAKKQAEITQYMVATKGSKASNAPKYDD